MTLGLTNHVNWFCCKKQQRFPLLSMINHPHLMGFRTLMITLWHLINCGSTIQESGLNRWFYQVASLEVGSNFAIELSTCDESFGTNNLGIWFQTNLRDCTEKNGTLNKISWQMVTNLDFLLLLVTIRTQNNLGTL